MKAKLHPLLAEFAVPINELSTWFENPRRGDIDALKYSLSTWGQRELIEYQIEVVDGETFKVVYVGNHRFQAAQELGWTHIAAIEGSDLDSDQMKDYAVANNRTSDLSRYDQEAYAECLAEMHQRNSDAVKALKYSNEEFDSLVSSLPPEYPEPDMPETCPACGQNIDYS